jgi:uncharacterized protein (TIGR03435 family)
MPRTLTASLVFALFVTVPLVAQDAAPAVDPGLRFEVASIKRHPDGELAGGARSLPDGTSMMVNNPLVGILGGAYPSETGEYIGLPDWMTRERYDITTKPAPGTTAAQRRQMMKNLLTDRMKFVAHDETREETVYNLVVARADGKLGPQIKTRPDCRAEAAAARGRQQAPPPIGQPLQIDIMSVCGMRIGQGLIESGGTNMQQLARQLRGASGRMVDDHTGLDGWYTLTLKYAPASARQATAGAPDPADAPDIFTALQEQLGLKLEPARRQVQVVVIDHVERPTEN